MYITQEMIDMAKDAILDAIENRKISKQCRDKGLYYAFKCIKSMKIIGQGHDVDKFYED